MRRIAFVLISAARSVLELPVGRRACPHGDAV
jgi:hypothetical protein